MTYTEKIDYTCLALYKQTKEGGMLSIIASFKANGQDMDFQELTKIKSMLETKKIAVFQVEKLDYRGQITGIGITFVEEDSFSKPGSSILKLES